MKYKCTVKCLLRIICNFITEISNKVQLFIWVSILYGVLAINFLAVVAIVIFNVHLGAVIVAASVVVAFASVVVLLLLLS